MGKDITLHPISRTELHDFFALVVDEHALIEQFRSQIIVVKAARRQMTLQVLASRLTDNKQKQLDIVAIYEHFPQWRQAVLSGNNDFASTFGFAAAALAGYLHPYWYLRNTGISALALREPFFRSLIVSLPTIAPHYLSSLQDSSGGIIVGNYQGGGYIDVSKLDALDVALHQEYREVAEEVLGAEGLAVVAHVLAYAKHAQTGILEASDIVVPFTGECASDYENLRAAHLHNLDDYRNAREHERVFTSLQEALQYRDTATILVVSDITAPGPLSEQIGELTNLRRLVATKQAITALPATIGNLQHLETLSLVFSGHLTSLPHEIGQLTNLRVLRLSHNRITALPEAIGQLSHLEVLDTSENMLTHLPERIGELTRLSSLSLRGNRLQCLPATMGSLSMLSYLALERNQLQTLPETFADLRALSNVTLADNLFSQAEKTRLKKALPSIKLQWR